MTTVERKEHVVTIDTAERDRAIEGGRATDAGEAAEEGQATAEYALVPVSYTHLRAHETS